MSETYCTDLAINTILEIIWKNDLITRAQLSRESGFSRSTITLNVDKLLKMSLLTEKPKLGSKRNYLTINRSYGVIVGIEMGANSCEIGICDLTANLLQNKIFSISYTTDPEYILDQMMEGINSLIERKCQIIGIGIGLPSPVDFDAGYAVHPAFMPGWHMFPIKALLESHYQCPVFVDNEVNTMALGESFLSKTFRDKNILFVKAGTAIGAGLIINGEIYRGDSGLSGNIGHIQIDGNTAVCRCGKLGCLEAVAGGEAIAKQAKEAAKKGKTLLTKILTEKGSLSAKEVKEACALGDKKALVIMRDAAQALGNMVGKLVIFFDPKAVIIGGGLTGFGPQYIGYIRDSVMRQCTPWVKSNFIVVESELGDSVGITGSSVLCIRQLIVQGCLVRK